MPEYKCEVCNYVTMIKTQYKRHHNTKKHKKNMEDYGVEKKYKMSTNEHKMSTNEHKMSTNEHKMSTNEHKMSTNEHKKSINCDYCGKIFSSLPNKKRHEKKFCKEIKKKKK